MPGFIYYIPQSMTQGRQPNPQMMRDVGLGYALDGKQFAHREVLKGPDGTKGAVIAGPGTDSHEVGYYPDKQTWRRIPGKHDVWVGYYTDDPPKPRDLARARQLDGHYVRIPDDGGEWLIPRAVRIGAGCVLPRVSDLDEDGNWSQSKVREKYRDLWDLAMKWQDALTEYYAALEVKAEHPTIRCDSTDEHETATVCLQTNYHIGRVEAVMLELIGTDSIPEIIYALLDVRTMLDDQKKTTVEQSSETPG